MHFDKFAQTAYWAMFEMMWERNSIVSSVAKSMASLCNNILSQLYKANHHCNWPFCSCFQEIDPDKDYSIPRPQTTNINEPYDEYYGPRQSNWHASDWHAVYKQKLTSFALLFLQSSHWTQYRKLTLILRFWFPYTHLSVNGTDSTDYHRHLLGSN